MTRRKKKWAIFGAALLLFTAFALIYTRPQTIEQRYPFLDLTQQCTQIWGYYDTYEGSGESDQKEFSVGPDDVRFEELLRLVREAKIRTKLTNLIPMYGMQYHTKREGDFQWTVWLQLENVVFPNGDTGTGDMLRFDNFFGNVEVVFDTENRRCTIKNQDVWLKAVLDCIMQTP